jgi:hypothetical protein
MESNTTVRAGMLTPMAKVSVAKRSYKNTDSLFQEKFFTIRTTTTQIFKQAYCYYLCNYIKKFWKLLIYILSLHYLTSWRVGKDTTLHTITWFYTWWFNICPNITSQFCIITIFKSFLKQNNDSNETGTYVHYLLLTKLHLSTNDGSWVVSIKQIQFFPAISTFLFKMRGPTAL